MSNRKEIHERVLNASTKEDLVDAYAEWADQYDSDLLDEMGYVAYMSAGKLLLSHMSNSDARILDAGCGTGIVGEFLHQSGYGNIEGLDYSPHMLEKAREKGVYTAIFQGDLMDRLEIADNRYDAVISVGAFTCGHVQPEALRELARITKPGGYICFTVREQAWEEDDYRARLGAIEESGVCQLKESHTAEYIRQEGSNCRICLYQVA
ncbi:methyltransferase domain-containing protein [Chloroflexales bacterium ZM16-3]|nr:methyltransferase domain-containing protein [Chloroflexales bacterium ZM16-3]